MHWNGQTPVEARLTGKSSEGLPDSIVAVCVLLGLLSVVDFVKMSIKLSLIHEIKVSNFY